MKAVFAAVVLSAGLGAGCIRVQPIEVKPIHVTVDINLRIERELDDFFGDIDSVDPTLEAPAPKTSGNKGE